MTGFLLFLGFSCLNTRFCESHWSIARVLTGARCGKCKNPSAAQAWLRHERGDVQFCRPPVIGPAGCVCIRVCVRVCICISASCICICIYKIIACASESWPFISLQFLFASPSFSSSIPMHLPIRSSHLPPTSPFLSIHFPSLFHFPSFLPHSFSSSSFPSNLPYGPVVSASCSLHVLAYPRTSPFMPPLFPLHFPCISPVLLHFPRLFRHSEASVFPHRLLEDYF